ncbi:MAG: DUF1566 domain-containing protein [Deltaproteobacteria bacterium]|nr:DUF1566 domain-containing protein [Deltaproteobacteria bacterium]
MHRGFIVFLLVGFLSGCNIFLGNAGEKDTPCVVDTDCSEGLFCAGDRCQVAIDRMWQISPDSGEMGHSEANDYCDLLVCDGQDDWRLPSISELRGLIHECPEMEPDGGCGVSDGCNSSLPPPEAECLNGLCMNCEPNMGPDYGCYWPDEMDGDCHIYWSSTTVDDLAENHWAIDFQDAGIFPQSDGNPHYVRCFRDGI